MNIFNAESKMIVCIQKNGRVIWKLKTIPLKPLNTDELYRGKYIKAEDGTIHKVHEANSVVDHSTKETIDNIRINDTNSMVITNNVLISDDDASDNQPSENLENNSYPGCSDNIPKNIETDEYKGSIPGEDDLFDTKCRTEAKSSAPSIGNNNIIASNLSHSDYSQDECNFPLLADDDDILNDNDNETTVSLGSDTHTETSISAHDDVEDDEAWEMAIDTPEFMKGILSSCDRLDRKTKNEDLPLLPNQKLTTEELKDIFCKYFDKSCFQIQEGVLTINKNKVYYTSQNLSNNQAKIEESYKKRLNKYQEITKKVKKALQGERVLKQICKNETDRAIDNVYTDIRTTFTKHLHGDGGAVNIELTRGCMEKVVNMLKDWGLLKDHMAFFDGGAAYNVAACHVAQYANPLYCWGMELATIRVAYGAQNFLNALHNLHGKGKLINKKIGYLAGNLFSLSNLGMANIS